MNLRYRYNYPLYYHHHFTFAESDYETRSTQSFAAVDLLLYCLIDIRVLVRRLIYTTLNSAGYSISFSPLRFFKLEKDYSSANIHARMIIIFQVGLLSVLIYFLGIVLGVLSWMTPFAMSAPNRMLAASQHAGLAQYRKSGPLEHSRTIILPGWLYILYAGMNFHCEHHLYPSIPYYHLPERHAILLKREFSQQNQTIAFFRDKFWDLIK